MIDGIGGNDMPVGNGKWGGLVMVGLFGSGSGSRFECGWRGGKLNGGMLIGGILRVIEGNGSPVPGKIGLVIVGKFGSGRGSRFACG